MYFVFKRMEDGMPHLSIHDQNGIQRLLDEMAGTSPSKVRFLTHREALSDCYLDDLCSLEVDAYLIIKGEIVTPTPVEIVRKLEIK